MLPAVVHALEHDVLEREPALPCAFCGAGSVGPFAAEIVAAQDIHHAFDAKTSLGGHQRSAFGGDGMVEADGQVAGRLFEKAPQPFLQTHRRHRNALGTPAPAPRRGEHLRGTEHCIEVVKRFALAHEHHVGQLVRLGQRIDLVEDVGHRKGRNVALTPRHAKRAAHFAPHLRTHAQRGALAVGDVDSLDEMPVGRRVEVLHRTVHRALFADRAPRPYFIVLSEQRLGRAAHVFHFPKRSHALAVDPSGHLLAHEGRQAQPAAAERNFIGGETQERLFMFQREKACNKRHSAPTPEWRSPSAGKPRQPGRARAGNTHMPFRERARRSRNTICCRATRHRDSSPSRHRATVRPKPCHRTKRRLHGTTPSGR